MLEYGDFARTTLSQVVSPNKKNSREIVQIRNLRLLHGTSREYVAKIKALDQEQVWWGSGKNWQNQVGLTKLPVLRLVLEKFREQIGFKMS